MAGERHDIRIEGGGPWGFRLFGGEEEPLIIAKLRKRSKAQEAGLQEGDTLLAINGNSCQGMSHGNAMGLIDAAGQSLNLVVLRGSPSQQTVASAFASLGDQQTVPAAQPIQTQISGIKLAQPQQGSPNVTVSNKQHTETVGDTTTTVKQETRTETFGGTTVTKFRREQETTTTSVTPPQSGSPAPAAFQVSKVAVAAKPGMWAPGTGTTNEQVDITIESKENVAPKVSKVPQFHVSKVSKETSSGTWQPSSGPLKPVQPIQQSPWQQQQEEPEPEEPMEPSPEKDEDKIPTMWTPPPPKPGDTDGTLSDSSVNRPSDLEIRPIELSKLIKEGSVSEEESTPDSPTGWGKRKVYADSSFYNDPSGKYPTIEEQVKMARKVAMSLTAPLNVQARGHKMFAKRKERSMKWTTDKDKEGMQQHEESEESEDEKFYQANPWEPQHTWTPPQSKSPPDTVPGAIPIAPGLDEFGKWRAAVIPKSKEISEEAKAAMSPEEFERMRLYDKKNLHDNVAPEVCFNLAQELKAAKGRSGKMFNKRKARSEKYTIDESNVAQPKTPPVTFERQPEPVQNRLQEMISMPKPSMSPWEAAIDDPEGDVDKAFDHLRKYEAMKIQAATKVPPVHHPLVNTGKPPVNTAMPPVNTGMAPPGVAPKPASKPPPQTGVGYNKVAKGWNTQSSPARETRDDMQHSPSPSFGGNGSGAKKWRPVSASFNSQGSVNDHRSPAASESSSSASEPPQAPLGGYRLPFAPQGPPKGGPRQFAPPSGPVGGVRLPFATGPGAGPRPPPIKSVNFAPGFGNNVRPSATLPRSSGPRGFPAGGFCDM